MGSVVIFLFFPLFFSSDVDPLFPSLTALTNETVCPTSTAGRWQCLSWVSLPFDHSLPHLLPMIGMSCPVYLGEHPLILQPTLLCWTFGSTYIIERCTKFPFFGSFTVFITPPSTLLREFQYPSLHSRKVEF